MRKRFAVIAIGLIFGMATLVLAAVATVTSTEYGYTITGGTSATTINSGDNVRIRKICFDGANARDTATLTTGSGDNYFVKLGPPVSGNSYSMCIDYGGDGIVVKNLKVTLSNTADILNIFN